MKTIAIIPARSGSKGLKDKNIKTLAGKPLAAYTIEAAIESDIFDAVMVSTDSVQYAEIAQKYGADVPFLRSKSTALDTSTTREAVLEVLDRYKALGKTFDTVCILQPTSPLRDAEDVQGALKLYREKGANAVISVCEVDHPPMWSNVLKEDCSLQNFIQDGAKCRRQELEKYYRINGAIYMIEVDFYYHNENLYVENSFAYVMEKWKSIDIDAQIDFDIAEFLIKKYRIGI